MFFTAVFACILFTPYIEVSTSSCMTLRSFRVKILDYKMLQVIYKENWYWYMLLEHDMVNLHLYNNSATSNLQTSDRWRPQLKTDGVEYAHHSNSKHQQNPLCWIILLSLHSVFALDVPFFSIARCLARSIFRLRHSSRAEDVDKTSR